MAASPHVAQFDQLIEQYRGLLAKSRHDDCSDFPGESNALVVRLRAAVERVAPPGSTYRDEIAALAGRPVHVRLGAYAGVAEALRDDMAAGWLDSLTELIHAETLADILGQAEELLQKGYKDAAAVIAGSALEAHLRLLCVKHCIPTILPSGAPKKADAMNSELVKNGVYNSIRQKSVTSWLGVRNAAAHGDYAAFSAGDVKSSFEPIRDFIAAVTA